MEEFQDLIGHKRLTELIVPASHDSGTYQVNSMGSSLAKCQQTSIFRQLEFGCRLVDIRYGKNGKGKKDLVVMHGPSISITFYDAIMEVL